MSAARLALGLTAALLAGACASVPVTPGTVATGADSTGGARGAEGRGEVPAVGAPPPGVTPIGADALLVPTGFGTLRQDDIALRLSLPGGLQVRALPLDESFLRLLSPDSYRAMTEVRASKAADLERLRQRSRLPSYSLWVVNFFAQEQGETRFSPLEIVIRNAGRDFRPLDAFALTPGFGQYRLRQRETQSAVLAFDGLLDPNQPLTMIVETVESGGWQVVLQRVERERALVRSRANAAARRDSTRADSAATSASGVHGGAAELRTGADARDRAGRHRVLSGGDAPR